MVRQAFIGPLIQTNEDGALTTFERCAILVKDGKISNFISNPTKDDYKDADVINELEHGQFMIPGFIDGHTHAVQFPNLGTGYDKPLLDWLETYTFPLEKKYTNMNFAEQIFQMVVEYSIKSGTTTACYFASLYADASMKLAQKVAQLGQRAFIGKVNMNTQRDDGYYESTEASIKNTMRFIEEIERIGNPLVKPIITPRFALSCDMELMQALAKIAREKDLHIQSHISENKAEVETVRKAYKEYSSYTAIYDAAGLLTNKTVLAHGIYLTDDEFAILRKRKTAIIHCPSSNTCLRSGLCNVKRLKANNIKLGLGTDVSGGQSSSMLDAMKSALQVSYHLSMLMDNYVPLSYTDVFHMATLGSANALSIDDKVGNLVLGKEFDALIIDLNAPDGILKGLIFSKTLTEKLERFIYSGDDRNIVSVYVNGKKIK